MGPQSLRGVQLAVRAAAGASVSFAIAELLKLDHPIIAFTAAVIVTDLKPAQTRELGVRRLGATLVGGLTGAILGMAIRPTAWGIGLSVLVAILISHVLRAREAAKVAGYICGLIVLDHSAEPWKDALARTTETGLGVFVAWVISYVPKLIRVEEHAADSKDPDGSHAAHQQAQPPPPPST